ncbi:hypothetical protein KSX62_19945, partial [Enterobacter hormaechei]|nr:hypothetical protein [Enterobacter hormaechei]MBY0745814.1 hypothetical protein [Enterobacter sp. M607]MBU8938906.1 hypothetical protein [Enterobacter hormaechei]MBU8948448.1 hypothetical protein [Enterobacter hormaechei]MBV1669220.1 hypothetical protein [Enterobacter hormaechei]
MLTLNKTKAALQSCQCHYEKIKQSQDTRVNAGGQSLSAPVISGTAPLARLRCTELAHTPFPQIWGDLDLKWFTEFGHLNRGDMLTSEQHRCHNE